MKDLVFTQKDYALFLHRIRGHPDQRPCRPTVKKEMTGQRDQKLCDLHRLWGWDVPMIDIDFLEYDLAKPVALIEYKKRDDWRTALVDKDANLRALIALGTRAKIPVFCVFYAPDHSMFKVCPLNDFAIARQGAFDHFAI